MFADSNDNSLVELSDDEGEEKQEAVLSAVYTYHCTMCTFENENETCVQEHMKLPHNHFCSACEYRTWQQQFLDVHKEKHKDYTFFCLYCVYQINSQEALDQHVENEHTCIFCNLKFKNKNVLMQHVLMSHERNTEFEDITREDSLPEPERRFVGNIRFI